MTRISLEGGQWFDVAKAGVVSEERTRFPAGRPGAFCPGGRGMTWHDELDASDFEPMTDNTATLPSPIGGILRRHRRHLEMSQVELAECAGIDNTYICKIESGARRPPADLLVKLCACLKTNVRKLEREARKRS